MEVVISSPNQEGEFGSSTFTIKDSYFTRGNAFLAGLFFNADQNSFNASMHGFQVGVFSMGVRNVLVKVTYYSGIACCQI